MNALTQSVAIKGEEVMRNLNLMLAHFLHVLSKVQRRYDL